MDLKNIFNRNGKNSKEELENIKDVEGSVSSDTFVKTEMTEEDKLATQAAHDEIANRKKKRQQFIRKILIFIIVIVVVIVSINLILKNRKKKAEINETMKNVQTARKMNISSEISGSGTLKPKDSYTITSLVEGNVTNVFFSVGDKVIKDQLLITIDSSTAYRTITSASSSVAEARDNYEQAKYDYEKISSDYENRTFKSPYEGSLRSFKIKAGDKLNNNAEVGTIVNDSIMKLKVPFSSSDASFISAGMQAILELQETGEFLPGLVESVANDSEVNSAGALIKYVTIICSNPGGLTTSNTAIAIVGNFTSVGDASFEEETNQKVVYEDGSGVVVEKLYVSEGAHVRKGTPLFSITEETFNNIVASKKKAYLQAEDNLTKAENSYDDSIDAYDEYFITAPIDGTVITKDAKVGDKIQRNTTSAKTLATIYDLSELTFDMDIDELDISNIKEGQEVNIQADAFANKIFKGIITNVSLVSANSNGVTNYPVTVTITDIGDLLPGMNVDAYVVLANATDVIGIPSDALQRGNVVYMLNTSPSILSGDYDTTGISDRVKNRVPEGFTAVNVETGISNENYIEITKGLVEGDQVYVSESSTNNRMNNFNNMGGMGGMGGPPGGAGGGRR